ncbi:LysR family transcriptional regulator [Caviibacterium pharyngocola]|uniref:LysR family transcriptional regulator n=1 Tax=Caviibacterium pharyngocola TaxID=28159 RepID=A0A2M8RUB2_9PAST|nr:LysR family transcriptional regulator [Caviibacterium pharyngocola]PJG82478.1 LysR family transcriptional regulator [Caviibacterium pharyngocola]
MYSLEQLRIFLSVCETGSFSASARQLKRVQSGISQAIANLEIDVGQELFDRSAQKPVLTPAGQALLPLVQAMMSQKNQLDQKIEALSREEESELSLVCDESILGDKLLYQINQFNQKHPITNLNIFTTSTFEAEAMIKQGKAQIGLVYLSSDFKNDFDFFTLGYQRFITVVSPQHELAKAATSISGEQLKAHRQLVFRDMEQRELWFSDRITAQFTYANSHAILLEMAKQAMGWTMLPEPLVRKALQSGELVKLDLAFEESDVFVPIAAIVSRSYQRGRVLEELLQVLKREFK